MRGSTISSVGTSNSLGHSTDHAYQRLINVEIAVDISLIM